MLQSLLNQSITYYPRSGYGADGREAFGIPATFNARVQETTKSKLLPTNQLITIDAIAYIDGNTAIVANDRVDYNGVKYKVQGRYKAIDGQGNVHHTKLELVKWAL